MSVEAGAGVRVSTPTTNGRDSPILRTGRQVHEDGASLKDKNYRRYAQGVERALASFESPQQEWADYISFLGRLLKALQARPPGDLFIPDRHIIATRLAQCLTPALPPGVHRKALDVYDYIFEAIGTTRLQHQLHLWLPGLTPVLTFGSLAIRPVFIKLIENHLLRLDSESIWAPLKAIILCILPGLEDESSEDHEQWLALMNRFRSLSGAKDDYSNQEHDQVNYSRFWQTLFLAIMSNPSRRPGALSYLNREMPSFSTAVTPSTFEKDTLGLSRMATAAITPEPGLLIRAMSRGLTDKHVLVQRGFLDLLVTRLPLNSYILQVLIPEKDLDELVFAAISVVGRKDMSLNRRLWSWFLGPDAKDDIEDSGGHALQSPDEETSMQMEYFSRNGLRALTRCIRSKFETATTSASERSQPFKLCLSLMDRWEIGGLMIPDVLIPAMQSVYDYTAKSQVNGINEVLRSAGNFFDGVESSLIWATFNTLVSKVYTTEAQSQGDRLATMALCSFIVMQFNIREEEMLTEHIPRSSLYLLAQMKRFYSSHKTYAIYPDLFMETCTIVDKLLCLVPTRAFADASKVQKPRSRFEKMHAQDVILKIEQVYCDPASSGLTSIRGLTTTEISGSIIDYAISLLFDAYSTRSSSTVVDVLTRIVCGLVSTIPSATSYVSDLQLHTTIQAFLSANQAAVSRPTAFINFSSLSTLLYTIHISPDPLADDIHLLEEIQTSLIVALWHYLDTSMLVHHVEAVRCIWQIDAIHPARRLVEAVITSSMLAKNNATRSGSSSLQVTVRRFMVFWTHSVPERQTTDKVVVGRKASNTYASAGHLTNAPEVSSMLTRPLLFILGLLQGPENEVTILIRAWLRELPTISKVLLILLEQLTALHCITDVDEELPTEVSSLVDVRECLYFFRILMEVVRVGSEQIWQSMTTEIAPSRAIEKADSSVLDYQVLIAQLALRALHTAKDSSIKAAEVGHDLQLTALRLLDELVNTRYPESLLELSIHEKLLQRLHDSIDTLHPLLQSAMLHTTISTLRLSLIGGHENSSSKTHQSRQHTKLVAVNTVNTSSLTNGSANVVANRQAPPQILVQCLQLGLASPNARPVLENWVQFLIDCLRLFPDLILAQLIPFADSLCHQITEGFSNVKAMFDNELDGARNDSDASLIDLLNALEHVIANAHRRMLQVSGAVPMPKSAEATQGFLGNMVHGVFTSDTEKSSISSSANSHLVVLLCFQDAVRVCFTIWSWATDMHERLNVNMQASHAFVAMRLRNRARRLLEHLFAAEALECMETLAQVWNTSTDPVSGNVTSVFGLLNVLSGAKPRNTIPAIFNAIYSRTSPTSLEPSKISSLTSELNDVDLVAFLIEYTRTLDDDAMDEIWSDCVSFLRDVLSNPLPHSQILPSLLLFSSLLAEKVDNTNFGEHRRMRKELGDMFLRLLTASFTTRPLGFLQEPYSFDEGIAAPAKGRRQPDIIATLNAVMPQLKIVLGEHDKIQNAVQSIVVNVTGPTLHAKAFPTNIRPSFLSLVDQLTKIPQANKLWKKDVSDAFNDAKFFSMQYSLVETQWLPLLHDFVHNDKERILEIMAKLSAPTTAGIVFGVGATSARTEADKKAQLNLRRMAIAILASPLDTFAKDIGPISEKLTELFNATTTSSPSCVILGDLFMLLRVLFLRISATHLATLWPIASAQLQTALSSVLIKSSEGPERFSNFSTLQAAKFLDLLVTLNQDDFQLHAWLFVHDSTDAVYHQASEKDSYLPLADALSTRLSEELTTDVNLNSSEANVASRTVTDAEGWRLRRPLLDEMLKAMQIDPADVRAMVKEHLVARILQPFLSQLSLLYYEESYDKVDVDMQYCQQALLRDLFGELLT